MKELRMVNGEVVDVDIKLRCTECHGGNDEAPGGALTEWHRKDDDPGSVVRCDDCGKRHSTDSLVDTTVAEDA